MNKSMIGFKLSRPSKEAPEQIQTILTDDMFALIVSKKKHLGANFDKVYSLVPDR